MNREIPSPDERETDLICLGEPMVEFNAQPDGGYLKGFGGDVSNVAIAAARQGARSAIVTRLGADAFGDDLTALWTQEGVDFSAVARDPDSPTAVYFVQHGANGHSFQYRRAGSAASRMRPETMPLDRIGKARALHFSGISQAISASAEAACAAALVEARRAGVVVSYDPNLRLNLWPLERAKSVIHETMRGVDIALPGLDDARMLTGLDNAEEIVSFYHALGPGIVALTLGSNGALVSRHNEGAFLIPAPESKLVDASGAGDCFDGAFLARHLAGDDLASAGTYAVAAAGLSVEGYGAIAPIPTGDRVCALLRKEKLTPKLIKLEGWPHVQSEEMTDRAASRRSHQSEPLTIALIAHDKLKPSLAAWVAQNKSVLRAHHFIGTGTTAGVVREAAPELSVTAVKSGPLGGDQQIGGMIANKEIGALIFFPDPLTAMPHDVDVKALLRIALLTDTPCAFNRTTADILVNSGFFHSNHVD